MVLIHSVPTGSGEEEAPMAGSVLPPVGFGPCCVLCGKSATPTLQRQWAPAWASPAMDTAAHRSGLPQVRRHTTAVGHRKSCAGGQGKAEWEASAAAAAGAVVAVLSAYARRLLRGVDFRRALRDNCATCLAPAGAAGDDDADASRPVLANLELGIERLAADNSSASAAQRRAPPRSARSAAPSASSASSRCCSGVPNSHLTASAQLYLAVVYKMERNDYVAARHLMQVFAARRDLLPDLWDRVFLPQVRHLMQVFAARRDLLPDLWDHIFLPQVLHLKVWFAKKVGLVAG